MFCTPLHEVVPVENVTCDVISLERAGSGVVKLRVSEVELGVNIRAGEEVGGKTRWDCGLIVKEQLVESNSISERVVTGREYFPR